MSVGISGGLGGSPGPTVGEIGEATLIADIARVIRENSTSDSEHVTVGPGDDAAVLAPISGSLVVSTDALVEGRHFRMKWSSGLDVGVKVAAANLADVVAMGAQPLALVVALVVPAETPVSWVVALAQGLTQEANRIGARVVGGDVSSGDSVSVVATALGELVAGSDPSVLTGAKAGDQVVLVGRLGWSAAGLTILSRGGSSPRILVEAHKQPQPDYGSALDLHRAGASSMTDVSDGLLLELANIAKASSVGVSVELDAIPIDPELVQIGSAFGIDPITWILGGGEDHAFVGTFPEGSALPENCRRIGSVEQGEGIRVVDSEGNNVDLSEVKGFDHFS